MKVAINIQADIQEIEVIINCMAEDENVQRIVSALDSLNTKLCCRRQGELFQIALNDILYIESVDRKTFIYTEQQIYETDKRLYELENHLKTDLFPSIEGSYYQFETDKIHSARNWCQALAYYG